MKKILTSLMLIGLVVFGFILPSNNASAAENTPLVDKVQITNIGNNEYIDYGQGKSIEFMHIKTQHSKDMHMTQMDKQYLLVQLLHLLRWRTKFC